MARHLLTLLLALLLVSAAQTAPQLLPRSVEGLVDLHTEQVTQAASLYEIKCSTCHGLTGGGLTESRLAFPETHRQCSYCHSPASPPQMSVLQMEQLGTAFSIGEPPRLSGEGALRSFPTAQALYLYIRATMPRHTPGQLSDEDYLGVTAYVLNLVGALPEGTTLTEANAASLRLHD
jgi:mono/diheme cytochrome c family protein